jgi:hypothetical protein
MHTLRFRIGKGEERAEVSEEFSLRDSLGEVDEVERVGHG